MHQGMVGSDISPQADRQGGYDSGTWLNEHTTNTYSFPIAFSHVILAAALGYAGGIDGGSFQSCGTSWWSNTQICITGADNGNGKAMWLVIGTV